MKTSDKSKELKELLEDIQKDLAQAIRTNDTSGLQKLLDHLRNLNIFDDNKELLEDIQKDLAEAIRTGDTSGLQKLLDHLRNFDDMEA